VYIYISWSTGWTELDDIFSETATLYILYFQIYEKLCSFYKLVQEICLSTTTVPSLYGLCDLLTPSVLIFLPTGETYLIALMDFKTILFFSVTLFLVGNANCNGKTENSLKIKLLTIANVFLNEIRKSLLQDL